MFKKFTDNEYYKEKYQSKGDALSDGIEFEIYE